MANTKFKNKESDALRINKFKKEFTIKMNEVVGGDGSIRPREQVLDFTLAAQIMHELGFLQPKVTMQQEFQADDIYRLLKCEKNNNILAENLQNVLMIISGERDRENEVMNDV